MDWKAESGLAYDENGNMTQDGTWHYEYDADEARKREDGESAGFDLAAARPEEAGAPLGDDEAKPPDEDDA